MKLLAVLVAMLAPAAFAQHWTVQYFYDQEHANFYIDDLAFPSAQRGVAVGSIYDAMGDTSKIKYAALVTSDGGAHWSMATLKERPRSLFFLNDSTGWMVTDKGIWFTEESGRTWKKIADQRKPDRKIKPKPPDGVITRVWFLDPQHGFAVGLQETVLETHDGGRTWAPAAGPPKPSANPAVNPAYAAYTDIFFDGRNGIVAGGSAPPRPDESKLPSWMTPERSTRRPEIPQLTLLLQSTDRGAQWKSSTAPLFGVIESVQLAGPDGLAVFGFDESAQWPSEVYRLDTFTGKTTSVFKAKDRRVTDCALFPGPRAFLAAVEPPGKLNTSPIPGKVRMLTSTDLKNWTEMKVDYKANARSLVLAGPDADHLWAATDTGMILHLAK